MRNYDSEFSDLVREVVSTMERMRVPYVIGGSVALTAWASPRTTHDLDLVIDLAASRIPEFCANFSADRYYIDADVMRDSFQQSHETSMGMYSFSNTYSGIKVDLFPLRPDDAAQQAALNRRVFVELLEGQQAAVYAPDDLLIQKLRWHVLGQSELQFRDCLGLLLADAKRPQPRIDWDYVENWTASLGPEVQQAWSRLKQAFELANGSVREGKGH